MATAENVFPSDEYIQNICDLCREDDQRIEAKAFCTVCMQYLCGGCHKAHTRANASKLHNCLTGNEMPGDQSKSKLIPRCKDHPEQVIDIFCCDHRVACCRTCKVFSHSKCKKLESIYDLASTTTSKYDVKLKLVCLKSMLTEFGRLEDVNEVSISEVELKNDDLIKNVRRVRQRIDKHLDKLEKELIANISKDLKNEVSHLTRRKDEITCIKTELRKTINEFEDIQKTGSDHQIFVLSIVAEENLQKYTSIMDAISDAVLPEVKLNINSRLKSFEHQVQSFGDFEVQKSQKELRRPYGEREAVYLTEVDTIYSTSTNTETT